jgi:hypothetical protein
MALTVLILLLLLGCGLWLWLPEYRLQRAIARPFP